jgi:hypothetical protein
LKRIYFLLLISFFAVGSAFSDETAPKKRQKKARIEIADPSGPAEIDNAYFRVLKNATASAAVNPNIGARVIVALTNVTIQSSKGDLELKRGQIVVFQAHESYQPPSGEFFEVAFKANHPPLKAPEKWVEPLKNTILYEDEQFRVFEERLAAGDTREPHSHAQRVVVRLNETQLTDPRYHETGRAGTGIQVPNTAKYAEPIVHVVRNVSKVPLFNIVIEFRIPHQNTSSSPVSG